jgi:tetratricopeptide (TPR) repeat protein
MAEEYRLNKIRESNARHFVAEINEEVENAVDQALATVERGQIDKGKAAILELFKEHPRNHTVHFGLGVVYAKKKHYDEAIACFDKATEIFPYFAQAYFNKGVACKENLDPTRAVEAFRKAVAVGDHKEDYVREANRFIAGMERTVRENHGIGLDTYLEGEKIFNDAFSCMKRKEWGRALEGFELSLAKNKTHVQSHGNMGICYARLGRKREALQALDKALEIDPSYGPALFNRTLIERLREGEILKDDETKMEVVEYYKDSFCEKNRNHRGK